MVPARPMSSTTIATMTSTIVKPCSSLMRRRRPIPRFIGGAGRLLVGGRARTGRSSTQTPQWVNDDEAGLSARLAVTAMVRL